MCIKKITHTAIRKLFVYGTLKSGEPNHKLLKDTKNGYAKFICTATTNNKMPLVIATRYHIPFVLNKPGTGNQVLGEIYDVDEKMMSTCDSLENYNYSAEVEDIQIDLSNETVPCFMYLLNKYPKEYLKFEMLKSYKDTLDLPYIEKSRRLLAVHL